MQADPSIYGMIRQPQPAEGPMDQYAKGLQIRHMLDSSDLSQMQRQQLMRQMEQEKQTEEAYAQSGGDPTKLRDLLYGRGLYKPAIAAEKANLEATKTKGEINKNSQEVLIKATASHRDELANINDPQAAAQWVRAGYSDPVIGPVISKVKTLDQSLASIPQDPQAFQQWKQQAALGATKFIEFQQKSINDPFLMGPGGQPVANKPVQDFQLQKSKAGSTQVNVNTEKSFLGKVADVVGEGIGNQRQAAQSSLQTIDTANRLRDAIASGQVMTGPGANLRVAGAQLAQSMGFGDSPEALVKTRETIKGLAELALSARASLKGQGQISDYEGKLLQRASTGDIDALTVPEISTLADLADKAARITIRQNSGNAKNLRKNPNAASMADFLDIEEPTPYQPKSGNPKAPSSGVTQSDIDAELRRRKVIK